MLIGTASGLVSLYDIESKMRLCTVKEMEGAIRQIKIVGLMKVKCDVCNHMMPEGVKAICSTDSTISILRVFTPQPVTSTSIPTCVCGSLHQQSTGQYSGQPRVTPGKSRRRLSSGSGSHSREDAAGTPPASPTPYSNSFSRASSPRPQSPGLPPRQQSETNPFNLLSPSAPPATASTGASYAREDLSISGDERGGWNIFGRSIIGVRRKKLTSEERAEKIARGDRSALSWEIWTVELGNGGERLFERASPLEIESLEGYYATTPNFEPAATTMTSQHIRKRTPFGSAPAKVPPKPVKIRFEDVALPFSRARPVIRALAKSNTISLAVGLGNQMVVVTPQSQLPRSTLNGNGNGIGKEGSKRF
jgi:hypothetical protein